MGDGESTAVERQSPEEAFALLSNDLRVDILRALGEAREPVSFSALREAVGERDSGKFNYHLGKLAGNFVTREDGKYALSIAGRQVYGALLSGAYTADASVEPFTFEGPCPMCGRGDLVAEYVDERAKLYCPGCGVWRNEFSFPPASVDQFSREELPSAFDRWMRATVTKVLQGFCVNCGGRVAGRLEASPADSPMPVAAVFECGRCGDELHSSPTLPTVFDPTAVAFFEAHGVDVFADPSWRYVGPDDEISVEVAREDPLAARVRVTLDGDELVATVGPDVAVEDLTVEQ